jgi:hypothetical protein
VVLAALPGEYTTVLGRQLAEVLKAATNSGQRPLMVTLANEYISYHTTKDEHDLQHYEGGSMLFGPKAIGKIEKTLTDLGKNLRSFNTRKTIVKLEYETGGKKSFGLGEYHALLHMDRLKDTYTSLSNVLMDEKTGMPVPNNPFFAWVDEDFVWTQDYTKSVTPSVKLEIKSNGEWRPYTIKGVPENDRGLNFVTTLTGAFQWKSRWITTWMAPEGVDDQAILRFKVKSKRPTPFISKEFKLAEIRKKWGLVDFKR